MTNRTPGPMSEGPWVTPILHPAHILRGQWAVEECQEAYLTRLVERVRNGREPPAWDTSQPPREDTWLYPSLGQLQQWQDELASEGRDAVVHDLETAGDHIICDGLQGLTLGTWERGRVLCLRFRKHGGKHYWTTLADHKAAVEFLSGLLDDPALTNVFHNGVSFDLPLLVRHGFRVRGPILDTMVMASRAYAERPKGLQFLATRYLWAPVWKTLTDEADEVEGKA